MSEHDLTRAELVEMHLASCEVRRWEGRPGFGPKPQCGCIVALDERLADIEVAFGAIRVCDECFVLFENHEGYRRHLCRGGQGR